MNGTVVKVFNGKNFGFIRGEDGIEYFFHRDDYRGDFYSLSNAVLYGRIVRVTYVTVPSPKGPRAADVYDVTD